MKEGWRKRVPGQSHSRKRGRRGSERRSGREKGGRGLCRRDLGVGVEAAKEAHADRRPQTADRKAQTRPDRTRPDGRPGAIKDNKHNKTSDAPALTATVMTTAWAAAGEQEDGGQGAVAGFQASVPSLQQRACRVGTRGNQPMQALQNGEPASPQAFLMEGVRERGNRSHSPSPVVGPDRPRGLGASCGR